jgi:hypothetical protein
MSCLVIPRNPHDCWRDYRESFRHALLAVPATEHPQALLAGFFWIVLFRTIVTTLQQSHNTKARPPSPVFPTLT